MSRFLIATLSLCFLAFPAGAGDYTGDVGGLGAEFSLDWHNNGEVTGTYHYPSRPGVTYRLSGNNHTEGKLYLEEFTGDQLTAKIYLSKALTNNAIVWQGEMHNTDGRKFQMQFARGRAAPKPAAPAPAQTGTQYNGNVGKLSAVYYLNWHDNGQVTGTYSYPDRPGVVYTLSGDNHTDGKLYLEEFTGNDLTAKCYLSKRLTDGNVIWEGEMKNTDGRQFPMTLSRNRSAPATPPPSTPAPTYTTTNNELDDYTRQRISALSKVKTQHQWDAFPKADLADENTYAREGTFYYQAKVTRYTTRPGSFTITLQTETPENDNWDHPSFTGPEITVTVARDLPIPSSEFQGKVIHVQIHESGELNSLALHGIGITHYRPSDSGKLEIRGVLESKAFEELMWQPLTGDAVQAAIAKARQVQFIPDKVALSSFPDPQLMFRTIRVTPTHGIVIHITEAGPGMLELESISLQSPPNEVPWTPVGTKNDAAEIPANQRTWEAG
ncbi:MAG: hypothetical protein HRU46_18850 [Verrucomicrobiales bacterium]|nr:hypothetical protein [Verrucomicrobiales bacterium]